MTREFPAMFHEIFNEPEQAKILGLLLKEFQTKTNSIFRFEHRNSDTPKAFDTLALWLAARGH